jgi:hypothetical protein
MSGTVTSSLTRWRVTGATMAGCVKTRETVAVETPARFATW